MIIIGIVILVALSWLLKIGPLGDISGWWVAATAAAAFVWFEFGESLFGLDKKKKAADSVHNIRQGRVKKTFGKK